MEKVAIIRGSNLNKFEMQNYEPLLTDYELVGFTTTKHNYDTSAIKFPVIYLRSLAETGCRFRRVHKLIAKKLGNEDYLFGLEEQLKGFDLVHTAELYTSYTKQALKVKRLGYVKKVVTTVWENIPFLEYRDPSRRLIKDWEEIDHFCVTSERAREMLIFYGVNKDKISVIMPGIDTQHFSTREENSVRKSLKISKDAFVIMSSGRLVWEKGMLNIVLALKKILSIRQNLDAHLVLVGSGPEESLIKLVVKNLNLTKRVHFLTAPYEKMPNYYAASDVFILPSIPTPIWQEQFGMVFAEAMACGKVVIGGLSGSIPEVIDKAGLLVQPADWYDIYEKLDFVISNPDKMNDLKKKARTRAENNFSNKVVAEKIEKVYKKVLN
ncbi:MAG: glycosyltransferase family 4 protein [Patescibacteria group bacterium]|nr:glycosyltransferase family 4 protein [Patescibacteria group bacterium]